MSPSITRSALSHLGEQILSVKSWVPLRRELKALLSNEYQFTLTRLAWDLNSQHLTRLNKWVSGFRFSASLTQRSYGDGPSVYSLTRKAGGAGDQTCAPGWVIYSMLTTTLHVPPFLTLNNMRQRSMFLCASSIIKDSWIQLCLVALIFIWLSAIVIMFCWTAGKVN